MTNDDFQQFLYKKGDELFRSMPWRDNTRPYYVLVSELMLQQTQVDRVRPKFTAFIERFPDERELASASLADVLILWQGLGYNRRAKFLHESTKKIVELGAFPSTAEDLLRLPGVGKNTAGAIAAYSFNQPSVFVETNIRTVYIHHFFHDRLDVDDSEIREKIEETIDVEHPREFYWALMDYGSWLKRQGVRNIQNSRQYKKQSPLIGSVREVRGKIIQKLVEGQLPEKELEKEFTGDDRFEPAIRGLLSDGLIQRQGLFLELTNRS